MLRRASFVFALAAAAAAPLAAQRATVAAADYARAEKFLAPNHAGLVVGGAVAPVWLPDGRFWFRNQTATGLIMLPNQNHGYGTASNYMMRRRWDYFVRWLMDTDPPKEYKIGS